MQTESVIASAVAALTNCVLAANEANNEGGGIYVVPALGGDMRKLADHTIFMPQASELLLPILEIVPLQLFAYYVAVRKGLDVDRPRNLVKSVTLE